MRARRGVADIKRLDDLFREQVQFQKPGVVFAGNTAGNKRQVALRNDIKV